MIYWTVSARPRSRLLPRVCSFSSLFFFFALAPDFVVPGHGNATSWFLTWPLPVWSCNPTLRLRPVSPSIKVTLITWGSFLTPPEQPS